MVLNNGLAEKQNKIKLEKTWSNTISNKYEDPPVFSVAATGEGLSYDWQYLDKTTQTWISLGVNSPKLRMHVIPPELNETEFKCVISNAAGSVESSPATLIVNQPTTPPVISTQPQSTTVDPINECDVMGSVYAQVTVGMGTGGGGGGGDEPTPTTGGDPILIVNDTDLEDLADMNEDFIYQLPAWSKTRAYIKGQINASDWAKKKTFTNTEALVPNDIGKIEWDINHNLASSDIVVTVVIDNNTIGDAKDYEPIYPSIFINDRNNITLTFNSDVAFEANTLKCIIMV